MKAVRGRGLMAAVDLEDDSGRAFAVRTQRRLAERGFLVGLRPGISTLRLDPALTIEEQDLATFLTTLEEVLDHE